MTEDDEAGEITTNATDYDNAQLDLLAILSDSVGIEVRSSTQTPACPVEIILTRHICVDMPSEIISIKYDNENNSNFKKLIN